MDTRTQYRQHIQNLLTERAKRMWDKRIQAQTIFDAEHDHYQFLSISLFLRTTT